MVDHNFMRRISPFLVLEVLKTHTDEEHGLKVTEIVELMRRDYNLEVDRKAVSRILNELLEMSEIPEEYDWKNPMRFSIKYDVIPRSTGDIRENWRICHEFEDAEIRLLMDLLESVQGYPTRRLMEKLQRLGSSQMREHGCHSTSTKDENKQMPASVDCFVKAIRDSKKVTFDYCASGDTTKHTVSPYHMAIRDGVYYLIGYDEDKEDITRFETHKIRNAEMLDEPLKDYHTVKGTCSQQYDIGKLMDSVVV